MLRLRCYCLCAKNTSSTLFLQNKFFWLMPRTVVCRYSPLLQGERWSVSVVPHLTFDPSTQPTTPQTVLKAACRSARCVTCSTWQQEDVNKYRCATSLAITAPTFTRFIGWWLQCWTRVASWWKLIWPHFFEDMTRLCNHKLQMMVFLYWTQQLNSITNSV